MYPGHAIAIIPHAYATAVLCLPLGVGFVDGIVVRGARDDLRDARANQLQHHKGLSGVPAT